MVASVPITPRLTSIHATAGCSAACYSACAASSAILCSTYVCCCHFGKARRPHGCLLMLSAVQRLAYANPQLWLQQNQSHNTNPVQTYTRRRAWLSSLACLRGCFGSRQLSTMSKSRSSTATDAMLHKETNSHSVYAAVQLHTEGSTSYACVTVQEQTCFALCSNCNKCISSTSVCMSSIACSHTP